MADGGFVIKFDGRSGHFPEMSDHPAPLAQGIEAERCFSCSFDYDEREYMVNETDPKPLPEGVRKIEIVVE